ncbi:MAG: methanogenesis marker 6 protein [Candidatus Nezhaarchaeota archaeon]|nr:methanogenesis marker 6 protein [Candidatus Nezhaarchaeota archaeon]
MKKTYIAVINPQSQLSADGLLEEVLNLGVNVTVKCTCFGLMVEGEEDETAKIIGYLRRKHPYDVFIKLRGYPINDRRVCRAYRGGGQRPGFHQLDAEYELLPIISEALRDLAKEPAKNLKLQREERPISVGELKEVVEAVLKGEG